MSVIIVIVLVFFVMAAGLGAVAYLTYQRKLRRAKAIERGLKMVPILIHLPPPSSDTASGSRDLREVMREKTAQAQVLYNLIGGTATEGFKSSFYGQRHVALELVTINGVVHFFAAVPVALVSVMKKAVLTAYPGARLEEVEDHNIFNQEGRLAATMGGEMVLRAESAYPIATYASLERDPMEALLTTLTALEKKDGVAIQIMLRPAKTSWTKRSEQLANSKRKGGHDGLKFSAMDLAKAAVKSPTLRREEERQHTGTSQPQVSNLELSAVESIEEKTKHPGFEVLIRVLVSTESVARSQQLLRDIATAFALFEMPSLNGFKFLPAVDVQGLVTAFIFRFFPPELHSNILNSVELATLFHLPDSQFTPSASVERQHSKQIDGPVKLPSVGLLFGYNDFRGVKKEIRLSPEDRRRHTYILGQTGTGKSTMLENLAAQDMLAGNGFAFVDPHGDSAEKLLALVPKNRAEDVIYFNPSDTEYPMGLNLFEFNDPAQKDFLVQETINMLYKLYDPGHTGIIGPRYEHWYRNAALTLMSDPNGATFIEIPKVFTDTEYLKQKFKYLRDPTVIDFWTKEMGQTSDYHKSEMLGWFVSKFGAFQNNEMMRNIIGQTKSSFNLRDVMDQKKILIVNLSKGRIGELNSQLLGMIFVIKFQAAAMARADVPEDQRPDFSLYVDEFQNFATDSFASILSEARKYRLNLIVANQFIGQLTPEIRDAVFGNIGTIVAHRMGPEDAEFMVKQFAPVFDASDLVNLENYHAAMRLMIGGLPSQPFSLRDSAPIGNANLELGLAIKQLSAAKFGHVKAQVEADIMDRFNGHAAAAAMPAAASTAGAVGAMATAGVPAAAAAAAPVSAPAPAAAGAPVAPAPAAVAAPVAAVAPVSAAPAMGAVAAPVVAAPAGVANGGVVAPPPIGAPPVDLAGPVGVVASAPGAAPVSAPAAAAAMSAPVSAAPVAPVAPVLAVSAAAPVAATGITGATLPGMAAAPPPIGAPPVGVTEAPAAPIAPVVTNTAGEVMAPAAGIIPEDDLEGEADRMAQAGAFRPLGSPIPQTPVPAAAQPEPAPIGSPAPAVGGGAAVALTPPPIGAPPVDLPSAGAPAVASAPVAASTPAVPSDPNTLTFKDITGGKPRPVMADAASVPVLDAPAPQVASAVAEVPVLAAPAPGMAEVPPVQMGPALGSGEALPSDPYANIDVLGDLTPPGGAPVAATSPAAQPVYSSEPLPDDPYANIDVLGMAPVPVSQAPEEPAAAPVSAAVQEPVVAGESAAAQVPVVSEAVQPEPEAREVARSVVTEEPKVAAAAPAAVAPEVTAQVAAPVAVPEPAAAPRQSEPALWRDQTTLRSQADDRRPSSPAETPLMAAPAPVSAPAPAAEPVVAAVPAAAPQAAAVSEPVAQVVSNMPVAAGEVAPAVGAVAPARSMSAPVAASATEAAWTGPEPEPREVMSAEAPVAEPALAGGDESFIHFVDPEGAKSVLEQTVEPEAAPTGELSLEGLPPGVALVKPEPVASAASVPAATPVSAAASGPVVGAEAIAPAAPAVTAPAVVSAAVVPSAVPSAAPAATPAAAAPAPVVTPVSAPASAPATPAAASAPSVTMPGLAVPLEHMAQTPPPIGAAPVALAAEEKPSIPKEAPKPEQSVPVEAEIAAESAKAPVPEMNAPLVAAMAAVPVAPEGLEKAAKETSPLDQLESVADMLEESKDAKDAGKPEEHETAELTEPKVASKSQMVKASEGEASKETTPEPAAAATSTPEAAGETTAIAPEPKLIQPEPAATEEAVAQANAASVQKAEHQIDDLLSESLIEPDDLQPGHHRLPEPVDPLNVEEVGSSDMELNTGMNAGRPAPRGRRDRVPARHGLKVIQPLEPIVPPKEEFARELAALNAQETATGEAPTADPSAVSATPPAAPAAVAAPAAAAVSAPQPVSSAPEPSKPEPTPEPVKPLPQPQAMQSGPVSLEREPEPEPELAPLAPVPMEDDMGLPQAESLEAGAVAKARAEQTVAEAAPEMTTEAEADTKAEEQAAPEAKAEAKTEPKPEAAATPAIHKSRRRLRKEKPAERIESEAEAEHNRPTAAEEQAGQLTGKLILPTGEKPKAEPEAPKTAKPPKLAPGEVYVDDSGNVVIGE